MVLVEMSKIKQAVTTVFLNKNIDLQQLPDGEYAGRYTPGKLLGAQVKVIMEGGKITGIELIEHINGRGKNAEAVIGKVIQQQSLDIDLVSGATMSSKTIIKAIEAALTN